MESNIAIATREEVSVRSLSSMSLDEVVEIFLASQDVKPSSRALYKRTLRQYFSWMESRGYALKDATRVELLEYKAALLEEGKSTLTISSYITSLRKFYEWCEAVKLYPNIARAIHNPKRKQQFRKQPLQPSQATELLNYFHGKALRDFAIVNLLLRTGLRTIEVARADIGDITFKGGKRVLLVQGKGRDEKDNFVVLTEKAYQPIADYLATRKAAKEQEPLFPSESNNHQGGRLTTRAISHLVKEGLKGIGLDDKAYTAHSLRHTTAVNILRAGGSLETAQYTLRHANPSTTQIYTATFKEEQRLAHSGESLLDRLY